MAKIIRLDLDGANEKEELRFLAGRIDAVSEPCEPGDEWATDVLENSYSTNPEAQTILDRFREISITFPDLEDRYGEELRGLSEKLRCISQG